MRFIHTSDWHLGHKLHNYHRKEEHQAFLLWLLQQLVQQDVDALIIAGDLFDSANPSAEAVKMFYNFLYDVHQSCPCLEIVIIGGNHDSAHKLEASHQFLADNQIHIIGGYPSQKNAQQGRLYVPIHDQSGEVVAWVLAVPYLRPSDLPRKKPQQENHLIEGVKEIYQYAIQTVKEYRQPEQGLIITGHCYMNGGSLSLESERGILGNHHHALPIDLFPEEASYVALGHLHLAQSLQGKEWIRYSGSPIPLSLTERHYEHQVLLIELEGSEFKNAHPLFVPRTVDILKIPDRSGGIELEDALELINSLPKKSPEIPEWKRPFLHVCIQLNQPKPSLKQEIFEALKDKSARLSRLQVILPSKGNTLAEQRPAQSLDQLDTTEVFKLKWAREFPHSQLPTEILEAFQFLQVQLESKESMG